jgi:death-on-curing protein
VEDPSFLTLEQIELIHQDQLDLYGGLPGIRDYGALESAFMAPQNRYLYQTDNLTELAASYLFHLAKNHVFVDGNKRVAVASCTLFLLQNGIDLIIPEDVFYNFVISFIEDRNSTVETVRDFLQSFV